MAEPSKPNSDELVADFLRSLQGIVSAGYEIAGAGAEQLRQSAFPQGTGLRGVYGVTVTADVSRPSIRIEPFAELHRDEADAGGAQNFAEPRTDFGTEADQYLILAEVPGIAAEDLNFSVTNKTLTFAAERGGRRYRKVLELPADAVMDTMLHSCRDGLLEIRVGRLRTE